MDDIMRQNPELMQQFTSAAVNSMGTSKPGFSGFMGNFMPGASNNRPPPPPMETQTVRSQSERTAVPSNRPDLARARNNNNNNNNNEGVNIQEQFGSANGTERSARPEMKGPSDISDLLSGLKTMSVNMPTQSQSQSQAQAQAPQKSSMPAPAPAPALTVKKEIPVPKNSMTNKTPRKQKSDKNIVSLDI